MSYPSIAAIPGREPITIVEMDLDFCEHRYGVAPCMASGEPGAECYNTRITCQDAQNYSKGIKTYRFASAGAVLPIEEDAYPCIDSVSYTSGSITPGEGIGVRASVTLTLSDFTDSDKRVDPYVSNRLYDPLQQGTFWGRLLARNPFYQGRIIRVYEGFANRPFSMDNFIRRDYVIESIDYDYSSDRVTIKAKDVLKMADSDRAQWPLASPYALAAPLDTSTTTLTFATNAIAQFYKNADPHVRINDEIIKLGTVSGATIINCIRGAEGSERAEHEAGDSVQACVTYVDANPADVIYDILSKGASVPTAYMNVDDWRAEMNDYLRGVTLTRVISEPTSCREHLDDLADGLGLSMYFDEAARQIRVKSSSPWVEDSVELRENEHIIAGSIRRKDRHDLRFTQVWHWFMHSNPAEDDDEKNFKRLHVQVDTERESEEQYNGSKIKKFLNRWITGTSDAQFLTAQFLQRWSDTPIELEFQIDAKDAHLFEVASVIKVWTSAIQDFTGAPRETRMQVLQKEPVETGTRYEVRALAYVGTPAEDALIIDTDRDNLNIWDELGRPTKPVNIQVIVNPGVLISGYPAITDAGIHESSVVRLVNRGYIIGMNGGGGMGGMARTFWNDEPPGWWSVFAVGGNPGGAGGDAIQKSCRWEIDNTEGFIFGGGGGGGGGSGWAGNGVASGGGGGGPGQGAKTIPGGSGGEAEDWDFGTKDAELLPGQPGGAGSQSGPGTGGPGGHGAANGGGNGGGYGQPGTPGGAMPYYPVPGGLGGSAGGTGGPGGRGGKAVAGTGGLLWIGGKTATRVIGEVEE